MMSYDVTKMYEWPFSVRLTLLILCGVIILMIAYIVDISPMQSQIMIKDQQVEDFKRQFDSILNKEVSYSENVLQVPKMQQIQKVWQQKIIDKAELPSLLDTLLKYGEADYLKFTTFEPNGESKVGKYMKVSVKIEMKGTYDQIATFMSQVANIGKLIDISKFTITKNKQSSSPNTETFGSLSSDEILTAELTLEIYKK